MPRLLRSALRAKWLRGALIALLLVAQHGALTHALMHAGWLAQDKTAVHASAQTLAQDDGGRKSQAVELCALDLAYSQVLGGATVTVIDFPVVVAIPEVLTLRASARTIAEPPPFLAQGPPALI